jgi:ATP-binding cassette subfamily B protein
MPPFSTARDPKLKGNINSLRMIMGYVRPFRREVFFALAALCVTSFCVLGLGSALRHLIDNGIAKGNPQQLNTSFTWFLAVVLVLAVASFFRVFYAVKVSEWVVGAIRKDVFAHVIRLDIGFFESTRTGELLSRFTADTILLQNVMSAQMPMSLRNCITATGGVIMLIATSHKLAGYTAVLIPMVVIPILALGRSLRKHARVSQEKLAAVTAQAEETIYGVRTIQALSLEEDAMHRYDADVNEVLKAAKSRFSARGLMVGLVIGLMFSGILIVLWLGAKYVLAGQMTPGELSAFVIYAVITAAAFGSLSESIGDVQQAAGATERLMELRALAPKISAPPNPVELSEPVQGRISFYDVGFTYPSRPDRPALSHIDLTVQPGETVALVGPSGAGKTTLFSLLLRFYDPTSGSVTIDGIDLRNLDPQAFRRHIGLVPQDPVIFSANAWDNIRYGNPRAAAKEILIAAENAAALEFLETLPDGLDTYLGEKGVRLSGGQRQRLAIARAMVRNPRILLLDEATSALDSENERKVQAAMDKLMQGRTTLVIAHRLSTVKNADRIVVLNEGKIEAVGKHEDLMQTSPLYKRLAGLQFGILV